jgi:hypothetical protein
MVNGSGEPAAAIRAGVSIDNAATTPGDATSTGLHQTMTFQAPQRSLALAILAPHRPHRPDDDTSKQGNDAAELFSPSRRRHQGESSHAEDDGEKGLPAADGLAVRAVGQPRVDLVDLGRLLSPFRLCFPGDNCSGVLVGFLLRQPRCRRGRSTVLELSHGLLVCRLSRGLVPAMRAQGRVVVSPVRLAEGVFAPTASTNRDNSTPLGRDSVPRTVIADGPLGLRGLGARGTHRLLTLLLSQHHVVELADAFLLHPRELLGLRHSHRAILSPPGRTCGRCQPQG